MKPAVNIAIIGLLLVIASLLAWPYARGAYIRSTKAYELDARLCDMGRYSGRMSGDTFAGNDCDALVKRKYGL